MVIGSLKAKVLEIAKNAKKLGKDDPRRIVHSMKVGLTLTLVSLFYFFKPLYNGFGQDGMWAVLTVVVVFEFTVGGTLSKSLNRGFATLLAGALGVGAEYFANLCGDKIEPIILGLLVFVLATVSTFMRFSPDIKKRYDYGVMIFILTFSLVAVSGYRVSDIVQFAHQRLATILIGGATCMIISIFVCPVWAGQDLHNLVANNIEKLAAFLQDFGDEFFSFPEDKDGKVSFKDGKVSFKDDDKAFLRDYKSVLHSKATEESLANFAWWEPRHGRFKFHHPWKQYLKIGGVGRECAYQFEALNGFINSKPQVSSEFYKKIQPLCTKMSTECSKSLRELASAIKNARFPTSDIETHAQNSKTAADELKHVLENSSKSDIQDIWPLLVIASVLIDIIKCVEKISASVRELSQKAHFQKAKPTGTTTTTLIIDKQQLLHCGIVKPVCDIPDEVVIQIPPTSDADAGDPPEKKNSQ